MANLRSIRLRGFKTFAKPTELFFEPGVTVIIGPNGSGKSNIADAVLWVLGEQSPGNLRGKSMQDIIFSGPDGRKASAFAEVSLVFENDCGSLPLDCSQVEITRRLVRDQGSEYRLNGAGCRLLDVQELVGSLGLGREMHSVVSQGKVEALLSSTPETRRALIEEAAGLGVFKKRRERTESKLERTRQNLLRVSDIEREVGAALRPLRQQVAAAERFAAATEDWGLAKGRWVLHQLNATERSYAEVEETMRHARARRAEVEGELADLRRQRLAEEEQFGSALQDREELSDSYHRVRSESERTEGRAVGLRQRVARLEADLDRARRRKELSEGELASLAPRVEAAMAPSVDELRLERVNRWVDAIDAALDESVPAYRALSQTEDDLKDKVFELEATRSRSVQERDFLRREIKGRERTISELDALIEEAEARQQKFEAEAATLDRDKISAQEDLRRLQNDLEKALSEREEARVHEAASAREEADLSQTVAGLESRETVLRDILERREGLPAGAQALLASTRGCRLLTDALVVEPGYERAVAAALGPLAQAVVWPERADLVSALEFDGPLEVVSAGATQSTGESRRSKAGEPHVSSTEEDVFDDTPGEMALPTTPPSGTRNLWELVSGPEGLIESLKALVPPTAVLNSEDRLDGENANADWTEVGSGSWRVVTRAGELLYARLHVARRRDAGAEAILEARNELAVTGARRSEIAVRLTEISKAAEEARALVTRTEEGSRRAEEAVREAESQLAARVNECDLHARRVEESGRGRSELRTRHEREVAAKAELEADLATLEETTGARGIQLEEVRASLRSTQTRLETLRNTVGRLRAKKSQAELVGVRLRERSRANQHERERAEGQHRAAATEMKRYGRRVVFLERYIPVVIELLAVVERLSGCFKTSSEALEAQLEEARSMSEAAAKTIREWGGVEAELQRELEGLLERIAQLQIDEARLVDRRLVLQEELAELRRRHLSPRGLTAEEVAGEDAEALLAAVERAERRREKIGPVNPLADQECAELEERARFLKEQRRDLESSVSQLEELISGLDEHIEAAFSAIFVAAKEHFSSVIATVFPGAKGTLKLTEGRGPAVPMTPSGDAQLDDLSEEEAGSKAAPGITLEVKLPNKAPRSLTLLSGGEKAMTAIAFLFSLFLASPCPFYILDEVEASLDDVNIRRFLSLIRKYRDKTQFIIITHQRQTMEVADTLYGVAMESDGTSRVLSRRFAGQKEARKHAERRDTPVGEIAKGA